MFKARRVLCIVSVLVLMLVGVPGDVRAAVTVGEVALLRGGASLVPTGGGAVRALTRGSPLYEGDVVEVGDDGLLGLLFNDGSRFWLGAGARMRIDQVANDDQPVFSAAILRGAFRFVTGLVAKRRVGAMRVATGAVATIGIRGTTVGGEVQGDAATIVLLADADDPARATAIEVANAHGQVVLDRAGFGTRVPDAHSPPSPPERMSLRAIDNLARNIQSIQRIAVPRPALP
ncbi:MAG: FecR domain-containing protein [Gammaproteobacteria bacterium]